MIHTRTNMNEQALTIIPRIKNEQLQKKQLLSVIRRKKIILERLVIKTEMLRVNMEMAQQEYMVKVGNLFLKDNQLDLEIIRLQNILKLMDEGLTYEESVNKIAQTYYAQQIELEKEKQKADEEERIYMMREEHKNQNRTQNKRHINDSSLDKPLIDFKENDLTVAAKEEPVTEEHPRVAVEATQYAVGKMEAEMKNESSDAQTVARSKAIKSIVDRTVDNTAATKSKYRNGVVAYSVPEQMQVGNDYSVKMRISQDTSNKEKKKLVVGDKDIPIDNSEKSVITIESIRVSTIMSASLTSEHDDFSISGLSTEVQDVEKWGYTEWEWRVTPLRAGERPLKLIVKIRIKNEQGEFFKDIVVFEKNLKVQSNLPYDIKQFFLSYWQWMLSTVIFPAIVWFYKKKKADKEKEDA